MISSLSQLQGGFCKGSSESQDLPWRSIRATGLPLETSGSNGNPGLM